MIECSDLFILIVQRTNERDNVEDQVASKDFGWIIVDSDSSVRSSIIAGALLQLLIVIFLYRQPNTSQEAFAQVEVLQRKCMVTQAIKQVTFCIHIACLGPKLILLNHRILWKAFKGSVHSTKLGAGLWLSGKSSCAIRYTYKHSEPCHKSTVTPLVHRSSDVQSAICPHTWNYAEPHFHKNLMT